MPATNMLPNDAISSSARYLRIERPSLALLQTGLSVFAVFIIIRHCLRCLYNLWCGQRDYAEDESSQPIRTWSSADEKQPRTGSRHASIMKGQRPGILEVDRPGVDSMQSRDNWKPDDKPLPRPFLSRRPPAPPLTPPELSSAVFTIDDAPHRKDSFIHQPNPDYLTSTSPIPQTTSESLRSGRGSFTKTLPIGIPFPQSESSHDADTADLTFSPSSYPPSSSILPPPPPPTGTSGDDRFLPSRALGVKGEIVSVLNDRGAGWTRHTRVYGGGVCLACAASGNKHGGGFYGATVTPEEMR